MTPSALTLAPSDALVLFGVTGDLAYKMTFPALYAMVERGMLTVPVVGVAQPPWNVSRLRTRAAESIRASGVKVARGTLRRLLSLLEYVPGDYASSAESVGELGGWIG